MNIREVMTWTNRELFEEIEAHGPQELAAQSAATHRQMTGKWITQQQAIQWRAELHQRHECMDEMAGIA